MVFFQHKSIVVGAIKNVTFRGILLVLVCTQYALNKYFAIREMHCLRTNKHFRYLESYPSVPPSHGGESPEFGL